MSNAAASLKKLKANSSVHLVQSSRIAQRIARGLVWLMIGSVIGMAFLPWQQTSKGTGQVVAYVPQERQQTVDSPIKGIVEKIKDGLVEGSRVEKDELLLEIQPAAVNLKSQLQEQVRNLKEKLKTTGVKADAYRENVKGFTEAREFTLAAAADLVKSAQAKLDSKKALNNAYVFKEWQARQNFERQNSLLQSGVKSPKEVEKLKKDWEVAKADLESLKEDILSLEKELSAKENEVEEKRRLAQTKIDYAVAMEQDALGSMATIRKEITEIEIKLSELERLKIKAPKDGIIFRLPVFEQGQAVKEGEPLFTIVPDAGQKAVELFIPGNDMPLVRKGDEVRLQFEGWPAVQFVGWPSVSVGTFGGKVISVDATDDGKGKFRILVLPDEEHQEWPSERFLRQGVRANGWVMLRKVSLGYEIWRQLNGFPVIISDSEPEKDKPSKPKIPK